MRVSVAFVLLIFLLACARPQLDRIPLANTGLFVEIEKTHAHLFFAEYDFKLHLVESGRRVLSADMTGDSGGLSRIDVFRVDHDTWAFQDHARAVCVDAGERKVKDCGFNCVDVEGQTIKECRFKVEGSKLGYFDFDTSKTWRYIREEFGGE